MTLIQKVVFELGVKAIKSQSVSNLNLFQLILPLAGF